MSVSTLSRRALGALAATSLLVGLLPAVATAATPEKRDITAFACPPDEVPDPGFSDDDDTTAEHKASIACVVWYELASGRTTTTYAPGAAVNRGQMATFIGNLLVKAGVALSDNPPNAFSDDDNTTHEKRINQLAEIGVVDGFNDGTYRPGVAVTRAQMASFLNRAYEEITGAPLTASEDYFTDDEGSFHEDNINAVAEAGVAAGKTATTYAPGEPVKRDQMATFLARETDLLVEKEEIAKPVVEDADVILGATSVRQGETLNGRIEPREGVKITAARVSGCGVTDQTLTLTGDDNAFELTIPFTAPTGDCDLVFTISQEGGDDITETRRVTVVEFGSLTEAPELKSVTAKDPHGTTANVTLLFEFDEELNKSAGVDPARFAIYSAFAEQFVVAEGSTTSIDGSTVSVQFVREQYEEATTAAVEAGAVEDPSGLGNAEGDAPLSGGSTSAITAAPDLVSVVRSKTAADTFVFTFDEPAYDANGSSSLRYHLVFVDGTTATGQSRDSGTLPSESRAITFASIGEKSIARAYVETHAVSDEASDSELKGHGNPLQSVDISGGGETPHLTGISIDHENNTVTYRFNRSISVQDRDPSTLQKETDGLFFAYRADGSEVGNSSASASGSTVVARFEASTGESDRLPSTTVGAWADAGAVAGTSGNMRTNEPDERSVPLATATGRTTAPDLLRVLRSGSSLVFEFDAPVEAHGSQGLATPQFVVYSETGERTELDFNAPAGNECSASGNRVTCSGSSVDGSASAIADAVLGAVEREAVRDADSNKYPNYASSRPVE